MSREAAVRLVNAWIDDYRRFLKDGGGSQGVHMVPKEALIVRIAEALEAKPVLPSPPPPRGANAAKKRKALGQAGG